MLILDVHWLRLLMLEIQEGPLFGPVRIVAGPGALYIDAMGIGSVILQQLHQGPRGTADLQRPFAL